MNTINEINSLPSIILTIIKLGMAWTVTRSRIIIAIFNQTTVNFVSILQVLMPNVSAESAINLVEVIGLEIPNQVLLKPFRTCSD